MPTHADEYRTHLLFPLFHFSVFSITYLQNLGTRHTSFSLHKAVVFGCNFILLALNFSNPITMTEESRLLEWYVLLENQCFMDQLYQSVSISQFLFHKIFKFLTILPITSSFSCALIFSLLFLYLGLFRFKFEARKSCGHSSESRMLTWVGNFPWRNWSRSSGKFANTRWLSSSLWGIYPSYLF